MMDDNATRAMGLSPLTVAIISVVSAAMVLFTYYCVVARWCKQHEFVPSQNHPPWSTTNTNGTTSGIENSITDLLPTYKYTKEIDLVSKTEDGTCAVCLCQFLEGESVRVLPECLHPFHAPCIDMWLYSHSNCPLCRTGTTPSRQPLGRLLESEALPAASADGHTSTMGSNVTW